MFWECYNYLRISSGKFEYIIATKYYYSVRIIQLIKIQIMYVDPIFRLFFLNELDSLIFGTLISIQQ